MATLQEQLQDAVAKAVAAADKLHQVVHGGAAATVATEGGTVKSVAKALADIEAALQAGNVTSVVTAARDLAQAWADTAEGTEVTAGKFSARHWAAKAAAYAAKLTSDFPTQVFTWRSGAGAPVAGTGATGDHYLDTGSDQIYRKAGDSWFVSPNGVLLTIDPGYVSGIEVAWGTSAYLWPGLDYSYAKSGGLPYLQWSTPPADGTSVRIRFTGPVDGGGAGGLAVLHLSSPDLANSQTVEETLATFDLPAGYFSAAHRKLRIRVSWDAVDQTLQHWMQLRVYFGSTLLGSAGTSTPPTGNNVTDLELLALGEDAQLAFIGGETVTLAEATAGIVQIRVAAVGEAMGDITLRHFIVEGSARI